MIQAALPIITALGAAGGAGLNAFSNQSRRTAERPAMPSVSAAMASTTDKKHSKELAKAAREDRLIYMLSQPEVIGLLTVIAGIYASQHIPFSENEGLNEGLQAISTMASVLIGLGYAGVGDLTTLLAGGIAGGFSLTDLLDLPSLSSKDVRQFFIDINPGRLLANLIA